MAGLFPVFKVITVIFQNAYTNPAFQDKALQKHAPPQIIHIVFHIVVLIISSKYLLYF